MFLRLEAVIQLDYVPVRRLLQYGHLLQEPALVLSLVAQDGALDGLDGDQVLGDFVARQVHLAEGTSAQHATDAVELAGALLDRSIHLEVIHYLLFQLVDVTVEFLELILLGVD